MAIALLGLLLPGGIVADPSFAATIPNEPAPVLPSPIACPAEIESLTSLLLRDLPSYANRVSQRAHTGNITAEPGYVLLAGQPEFEPLPIASREYPAASDERLTQVFFTTLERQYVSDQPVSLQQFHWLFLTQSEQGWQFVLLFSAVGSGPETSETGIETLPEEPPTPPQDTSQGVIGRAIQLWLRDCRAGSIRQ
jgi:hypothetical protein